MENYVLVLRITLVAALLHGSVVVDNLLAQRTNTPTVKWTAVDAPDFRYRFLERVKTTTLLHATPETGTFNLHGYLTYFKGALLACWDSQARDENTSGQHGVFRYSADNGKTWSDPQPLFPPLADNVPASVTNEPKPIQTSQGFAEIEGRLYAVTCVDRVLRKKVYRFNEVSRKRIGLLGREVREDGTLGPVFWISDSAPEPEPGYPAIPVGCHSSFLKRCNHAEGVITNDVQSRDYLCVV